MFSLCAFHYNFICHPKMLEPKKNVYILYKIRNGNVGCLYACVCASGSVWVSCTMKFIVVAAIVVTFYVRTDANVTVCGLVAHKMSFRGFIVQPHN